MRLQTERLLIRSVRAEDAEALARLWTDPEVTRFVGGPRDHDGVLAALREDAARDDPPSLDLWAVLERESGRLVGHCGLLDEEIEGREEVEVVYVVARGAQGRGHATEAATAIRDHALSALVLRRLVALIDPENAASERVAAKPGMSFEREAVRPDGNAKRLYALTLPPPERYGD